MSPWKLPFRRWPLPYHALLATLVLGGVAGGARWWVHETDAALVFRKSELQTLQNQIAAATQSAGAKAGVPVDPTSALSSVSRTDDVVHDISRSAHNLGVQIASLSLEPRPPTATELGKVHFNLVANAEYRTAKAWMAELLGRYPALGIQSLSMRGIANDPSRLDVRLALVLVTKD